MFRFPVPELPDSAHELRRHARRFLADELEAGRWSPTTNSWMEYDAAFSKRCGDAGLVGLTLPREYGGHERSAVDRHVVLEEMLAAGAPVGMHWIADRQSGPQIARHGSEALRRRVLPRIAAGTCCFSIGMSEPGAGSDLAAVRTRADAVEGGLRLNGSKLWTSHAHRADFAIVLARTSPAGDDRHAGLTQLVVDMRAEGVATRPMIDLAGSADFNEVLFDDVFVPESDVLGQPGDGWRLVVSELAWERSGPERFLSAHAVVEELVREARRWSAEVPTPRPTSAPDAALLRALGAQAAQLMVLRQMSGALAAQIAAGRMPEVEAALVKDLGAMYERSVADTARRLAAGRGATLQALVGRLLLAAPSFSLRGGTREILRGIVAKRLEIA
jgi:alkylation response protein AidB-like acyl-CoA dehydrogenase